jgi:hypothetical protein
MKIRLHLIFWIALALFVCTCGDISVGERETDEVAADDDTGAELTWENFGQSFFGSFCTRCHFSPPTNSAPFSLVTYGDVISHLDRIQIRAIEQRTMPPSAPIPADSDLEDLEIWIDAGAPEAN